MTTQPEALRLADACDTLTNLGMLVPGLDTVECAAELRRLVAQRDALLEAYRKMKNAAAAYSNFCDDNASTSKLEREFEAADAIARAAIKAVEEST